MFKLRDYQLKAHDEIIDRFRKNLKTLLVMATGAGKSKTIVSFVEKIHKHYIIILVVKNRKLVNQLAEDTKLFNLDYGVFMANHDEYDDTKLIQVCSIDTINTRGQHPHITSKKDIVLIIDEADQAKSATYQSMINRYLNRKTARTFLLGMTATPYNGLSFFDTYINPITPLELLKRGYLVDYKYYIPKTAIDSDGIEIKRGEFVSSQVSKKMNTQAMIKNCFNAWLEFGDNRQTLAFCSSKQHAEDFRDYINSYYGKEMAAFVFDKTSDADRKEIFNKFENGVLRFLINIKIITRGVDIPCIGTIIDMALTLNVNLHIQKLGRGSRKNDFYDDCIVIDTVKNLVNNGHFYQHREISLEEPAKRSRKDLEDVSMRVCVKCFRADTVERFGVNNVCPYCGTKNKPLLKKKLSKKAQEKLFLQNATPEQIEQQQMIKEYKKILWKYQNLEMLGKLSLKAAREKSTIKMLNKYGKDKCLKIKKSINLTPEILKHWEMKNDYVPLGGLL